MNPFILKFGFSVIMAVVVCVAAYQNYRRRTALPQHTYSSFDGSDITICCICLEQLSTVSENELVSLSCKHKFHKCCIRMVFSQQSQGHSCPLCRKRLNSDFVGNILKTNDF